MVVSADGGDGVEVIVKSRADEKKAFDQDVFKTKYF